MTPRPIYRWKSFWLGLCMLLFVAWAGHFSLTHLSGVGWRSFHATQGAGGVQVGYGNTGARDFRTYHVKQATQVKFDHVDLSGGGDTRMITFWYVEEPASPWVRPLGIASGGELTVFLPHWLVLLVMAALWSVWLLCHWKREQRKRNA